MPSKKTTKKELEQNIRRGEALQREPKFVSAVLRTVGALVTVLDPNGRIVSFNSACEGMTGYSFAEVEGRCFWDFLLTADEIKPVKTVFEQLQAGQFPNEHENYLVAKNGTRYLIHWTNSCLTDSSGAVEYVIGTGIEVTEQRRAQKEREVTIEFLRLVNASADMRQLVESSVRFFHEQSGCDAVGIRLRDGDDYPYYEAHGFPEEFLQLENSLCVRDADGAVQRDQAGEPVMACMCGNVICGRFDPSKSFFTPAGSFWANDTTRLLAMTIDADRQTPTRNRCNGEGYESVALIALRSGKERLGLLQLNDRRKGMFSPQIIALWERLAGYLGVALAKARAEAAMRENERLQALLAQLGEVAARCTESRELIEAIGECVAEYLGVSRCGFSRVDVAAGQITVLHDYHSDLPSLAGVYPISAYADYYRDDALAGRAVLFEDTFADPRTASVYASSFAPIHVRAHLTVPLLREGKWVANFWVSHHEPRRWTATEVQLMQSAAEQVWVAIERKQAEEAFRRSQRTFAELVERAPFGIYVVDSQFRIAQMNAGSQNGAFRNVRPLIGRNFTEAMRILWPEPVAAAIIAVFRHTLETGEPYYSPRFTNLRHDVATVESYEWELHRMTLPDGQYGVICYYYDSTSLRQTEAALRESEERFATAFHASPVAIVIGSLSDASYIDVNEAFLRTLGYCREEVVNRTAAELNVNADPQKREAILDILRSGKGVHDQEATIRTKRGQLRKVLFSTEPIKLKNEDCYLSIFLDVTERTEAEARVAANLDTLTKMHNLSGRAIETSSIEPLLQETMDTAVAIVHADKGTLQLLEGNALRIVAHHGHERPFLDFFAAAENVASVCGEATRRGERVIVPDVETSPIFAGTPSLPVLRAAGVRSVQSTPLMTRNGRLLGILTTQWNEPHTPDEHNLWRIDLLARQAADLIEHKQVESALRASEASLKRAQEIAHLGSWELDLVTNHLAWSDEVYRIFGLQPQEFGATFDAFLERVHPDDRVAVEAAYSGSVQEGRDSYEIEHRVVRQDSGEIRHVQEKCQHIRDASGSIVLSLGMVLDITERKAAEEALRTALREKEVLLKEVHHRVKNNMQVISSLVDLQADQLEDAAIKAVLQDVTHRVRSMALVHEKLYQSADMTRIEFAEYSQTLLGYLWRAHGNAASDISLSLDMEPIYLSVNAAVPCGLILNELATNALKHAFRGRNSGEVIVSLHGGPEGQVRLRVRDNGTGLPPGLDWRQTKSLGLRLVQILAKQLSATVEFSSGEGTEFSVSFGGPNL